MVRHLPYGVSGFRSWLRFALHEPVQLVEWKNHHRGCCTYSVYVLHTRHCTVLYSTIRCNTVQYCAVLCYAVLCCAMLLFVSGDYTHIQLGVCRFSKRKRGWMAFGANEKAWRGKGCQSLVCGLPCLAWGAWGVGVLACWHVAVLYLACWRLLQMGIGGWELGVEPLREDDDPR